MSDYLDMAVILIDTCLVTLLVIMLIKAMVAA